MTKRWRVRVAVLTTLFVASVSLSAPSHGAPASIAPVTVEGDFSFAFIMLGVSADDLRPYVPQRFASFGTGGSASAIVGAITFTNVTVDGVTIPDFEWSELMAYPSGDPGNPIPTARGYYIWRLSNRAEIVEGLGGVGLGCGGRSTFLCHVPQLSVGETTADAALRVAADVPWAYSPYSMSSTFADVFAPVGIPDPLARAWLRGTFGIVREDVHGSHHRTALGVGSVRAPRGTPLFRILGRRTEARGPAMLWRTHFVATFTVTDEP